MEKDATISDIRVTQYSPCKNIKLVGEARRVIMISRKYWVPGMVNGNAVRSYHVKTINFAK